MIGEMTNDRPAVPSWTDNRRRRRRRRRRRCGHKFHEKTGALALSAAASAAICSNPAAVARTAAITAMIMCTR